MDKAVPEIDEQALQHFLSHSPWDAHAVIGHVAERGRSGRGLPPDGDTAQKTPSGNRFGSQDSKIAPRRRPAVQLI
ncbi:MAG: hypothetical protein JRJ14_08845 [Deltaproteobacteria bacterium]|nr:hypothetical protein [Deltaproteobacteria bacterium]